MTLRPFISTDLMTDRARQYRALSFAFMRRRRASRLRALSISFLSLSDPITAA